MPMTPRHEGLRTCAANGVEIPHLGRKIICFGGTEVPQPTAEKPVLTGWCQPGSGSGKHLRPSEGGGRDGVGEVDEGGEEDEAEEAIPEERPIERASGPRKPSEEEVRRREVTYLPYRSWCWACVQGSGKNEPHRARRDEKGLQEFTSTLCSSGVGRIPAGPGPA